jgi:hypothetical protein
MMKPVSFARTVKLIIQLTNGQVKMADGSKLPALEEGTNGELIVPAMAISDFKVRETLTSQRKVPFLPVNTVLWAKIRPENIPDDLQRYCIGKYNMSGEMGQFVSFVLIDNLQISLRGSKSALLRDCECNIPALDRKAKSVNHAYTLISTAFELDRRSHTGNVFQEVCVERDNRLLALDKLRMQIEANSPFEDATADSLDTDVLLV